MRGGWKLDDREAEELRLLLSAAETIKPKLLSLLTLGPDALDNHAYAIKARVKTYDSAVTKIAEKREKGAADYAAAKMTDVIGIRVLCLWPDDIPVVLDRLIRIIREIAQTGLSSFAGQSLADILTEVIVYKAANSPAVYDVIGKQLMTWLIGHGRAGDCVRIEDSPRDRPYSSVHMVVWCRAQVAGRWIKVPVEFQIRTSLEDVWSEVDHRLRYKRRTRQVEERIENVGNALLDQLKGQLDIAASTVTSARELFTPAPPNPSSSLARVVPDQDPNVRWGVTQGSERQKTSARELSEALDTFYRDFERAPEPTSAHWDARLEVLAGLLRDAIASRAIDPSPDSEDERAWLFASRMELAQVFLWRGRLKRMVREPDADTLREIDEFTEICLKTYLELINSKLFEHSAQLWFRFGNALLDLRGDFEQAYIYVKRANSELADDQTLRSTPLAIAIPRLFAYVLWRMQNDQYLRSVEQFGMHSAAAEHALAPLKEAIRVITPLLGRVDEVRAASAFWVPKVERGRVANNLLSYAWCLGVMEARARGVERPTQDEISEAVLGVLGKNLIRAAYDELANGGDDDDTIPINRLHTLATAAFILKDRRRLPAHTAALRERLTGLQEGNKLGTDEYQMQSDLSLLERKER